MKLCVRGEGEMTERNTFCSSSDGRNRIETYVWGTSQTDGGWGHGGPNEKQMHPLISNSLIERHRFNNERKSETYFYHEVWGSSVLSMYRSV